MQVVVVVLAFLVGTVVSQHGVLYPPATTPMPLPRPPFSMYTPSPPPRPTAPGCDPMRSIHGYYSAIGNVSYPVYGWATDAWNSQVVIFASNGSAGQHMDSVGDCITTDMWTGPGIVRDALVAVMSVAKKVIGALFAYKSTNGGLYGRGQFDWQDRPCSYYPAWCQGGKENSTFENVGSYMACIPIIDTPLALNDIVMEVSGPDRYTNVRVAVEKTKVIPDCIVGKDQGYPATPQGYYDAFILEAMDPEQRTLQQILDQDLLPLVKLKADHMHDTQTVEWYLGIPSDQTWLDSRVAPIIDVTNPNATDNPAYDNWAYQTVLNTSFLPHKAFMNPEENINTKAWINTPGQRNKYDPSGFMYVPTPTLHYLNMILTAEGRVDQLTQLTTRENFIYMSQTLSTSGYDYILQQNPPRWVSLMGLKNAAGVDISPHGSISDGMFGSVMGSDPVTGYTMTHGNVANMPNNNGEQLIPITTSLFNNGQRLARLYA